MAKANVSLRDGYKAEIRSRDHVYYADEPLDEGGSDEAAMPTEMMMGALGSCTAITIKLYAERKGWPLESVEIDLEMERFNAKDYSDYDGDERYIHEIREDITLHGDLDDEQRERLMEIAEKCPVARAITTPTFWKQSHK